MTIPAGFSRVCPVGARPACGDVAQLGEHCLRKAGVESSNLFISTKMLIRVSSYDETLFFYRFPDDARPPCSPSLPRLARLLPVRQHSFHGRDRSVLPDSLSFFLPHPAHDRLPPLLPILQDRSPFPLRTSPSSSSPPLTPTLKLYTAVSCAIFSLMKHCQKK